MLPDIAKLAGQLKTCLQESDDVPRDITMLFDNSLFKLDTSLVPNAIKYVIVCPHIILIAAYKISKWNVFKSRVSCKHHLKFLMIFLISRIFLIFLYRLFFQKVHFAMKMHFFIEKLRMNWNQILMILLLSFL